MDNPSLGLAFFAGIASFLSPCVFALVPAYVGYLGGRSARAAGVEEARSNFLTFTHGVAFVLGFSAVFILLGALSGVLGAVLRDFSGLLTVAGGVVVIVFGLHMLRVINIPFLNYDLRVQTQPSQGRYGYLASALMGVFFSAGWAPCVGPVLGTILTFSINGGSFSEGAQLLSAYSAGLALPFLLAATQIGWVTSILRRYGKVMHYVERVMGVVLVVLGILLALGRFQLISTTAFFAGQAEELAVGRLLLAGLLAALALGLIPGLVARLRGKSFLDYWFLSAGASLILLVLLYLLGALNSLLPLIS
ncbi:MAG: cytochrome c biogenesis protein CcdA [Chloroflexi bacterium]|nr:cytochrome c biogenesis protein CcdA [Chloroflexota bacterium]